MGISKLQAFIKALLSTPASPQRFSFFTVCLVQWFRGVAPWQMSKEKIFKFRSTDCWKMHFSWILLGFLGFYGDFLRKIDQKDTYNFPLCMFVSIQTKEQEEQENSMENLSRLFQKQKRKKNMNRLSFITQFKIFYYCLLAIEKCSKKSLNCDLNNVNQHPLSLFYAHIILIAHEFVHRTILCAQKSVHANIKFVNPCLSWN